MTRRLEMDLEPGTRFRLFGAQGGRTYEVAGFTPGRSGRPDARVLVRRAGSTRVVHRGSDPPQPQGEARRSVERWVLAELERGGWPWPTPLLPPLKR